MLLIILVFSTVMFWWCEDILIAIDILPENAIETAKMVRWLIPGMILQGINFQLQAFCMAQQLSNIFGYANIVSIVAAGFTSYF